MPFEPPIEMPASLADAYELLAAVTAAIMLIGAVGLTMDSGFQAIGRRVAPAEEKS